MNPEEIWKDIPGLSGYQASTLGNIKSNKANKKGALLSYETTGKGYLRVTLCHNAVTHKIFVHRLVALTFVDNSEGKSQVNHKNGVKTDNRVENLEWCTPQENIAHAYRSLGKKSPTLGKKYEESPLSKKVAMYSPEGFLIRVFSSTTHAETAGFEASNVSRCCNGKLPHVKGFIFKYL